MNHVNRAIAAAKGVLAELAELEATFPWLKKEADREDFGSPRRPMDDQDAMIYERYVNIRVQASLAAETLRLWGVSL
jgi:hypothetical protein